MDNLTEGGEEPFRIDVVLVAVDSDERLADASCIPDGETVEDATDIAPGLRDSVDGEPIDWNHVDFEKSARCDQLWASGERVKVIYEDGRIETLGKN